MKGYHIAVVGATGATGTELLRVLERRSFPVASLRPIASARSAGKLVRFRDESIPVQELSERSFDKMDIVCFGAGYGLPSPKVVVYISSADWMPRNLDRRVEAMVPIDNPTVHQQVLSQIVVANLKDQAQSWFLRADGSYARDPGFDQPDAFSAHTYFMTNPSLSGRGRSLRVQTTPGTNAGLRK